MGLLANAPKSVAPVQPRAVSPMPLNLNLGGTQTSTPAIVAPEQSTLGILGSIANFGKDFFTGSDATNGGIARNTVLGLPKAALTVGKGLLTGLKEQFTNPSPEQKNYESTMLPRASTDHPIIKTLTDPGVTVARTISRFINPGLQPLATNLAEIQAISEKGGIADQVASGKIPPSVLDEFAVLHKTDPQIVGDVAQAVLTAYAGSEAPGIAGAGKGKGLLSALKTGGAKGLQIGEAFGASQALSSGTKDPLEALMTIGQAGLAGGVLGAITSGAIPVSEKVLEKVKEAKIAYDALPPAEKQGGFIKNPLAPGEAPSDKPGMVRTLTELDKTNFINHGRIPEGFTKEDMIRAINPSQKTEVPAPKETVPTVDKNIAPSTIEKPQQIQPTPERVTPTQSQPEVKQSLPETLPRDFSPDKYVAEQVKAREGAKVVEKPGVMGKVDSFLKMAKTKLVDFTAPIEDTLAEAKAKSGIKLLPSQDIHNQIDRVLRSPTLAGQFAKDNGIVDVIRKVDNIDNLDQYLIAKHAIELSDKGIETGRNITKDKALVASFGSKYEDAAKTVSDYSRKLLDYSVESGLISKDLADALKQKYPDYVPFSRVFNEMEKSGGFGTSGGVASLSKQTIVQKISGSERQIESPIQSLLAKTNDAFKQGEKNIAAKLVGSYEKLPGNPFQLKEITGEPIGNRHTITFFDNGEKRVFETTKAIAEAAKALNVQQLNILGKMFALPVRLARVGITGINLPFIGANIAKDAVSAFINSDQGLRTSIANPVNFVRSLFSAVGHDKLYEDMVRAGGAGTSYDIARNQTESTVANIRAGKNIGSKILYTVSHPSELLRAVEDIVNRGEEFTRIQQFRGVKEGLIGKGMSEKEATIAGARQARDATVNFARRGEWGSVLNSAFLYINAGIQGSRTLLRNLKDKPAETTTKIAVSVMFPVAVATAWNLSDPKRQAAYQDIADYEKQNNIIIVPDNPTKDAQGKWNVIKIPLSQEINNMVGPMRIAIEQAHGVNQLTFGDFARAIVGTVSPIAPTKGDMLSTLTPQAIKPSVEATANTNLFTGIPQVPASLQKLSPENQVKPYTSGTAIEIGQKLGVSPIKVEEFIKGTFGGVGSQALNVLDRVQKVLGNKNINVGGQDIMDAISARFSKASGGVINDKSVKEIQDLLMKQADKAQADKTKAISLDMELSKLSPADAKLKFDQLIKSDPTLAKKVITAATDRKNGLTYEEKIMNQLQVTNGERAKYIYQQIMDMPAEKRASYYNSLVSKKIISASVAAQIQSLNKK